MSRNDPFRPLLGDEIGPTPAQRTRSGIGLVVLLVVLGVVGAAVVGVLTVVVTAAFKAALG